MHDDLSADAALRVLPCLPALDATAQAQAVAALEVLFAEFAAEGRVTAWRVWCEHDGLVLLMAWQAGQNCGGSHVLSGCSQDRINRVLADLEASTGASVLAAPGIVVETPAGWQVLTRAGLRRAEVTPDSRMLDVRCTTLGEWRQRGLGHIAHSWLAELLAPAGVGR